VTVEQSLAQVSNTLLYSSMAVYTGALGAFVTDLAGRGARVAGAAPAEGAEPARQLAAVGADAVTASPAADLSGSSGIAGGAPSRLGRAGGIAMALTWLALGLHAAAQVTRALAVQRAPWGNMFEFATSGAAVVTAVFCIVELRRPIRYLGTFVLAPVLLTLGLALTVFYTEAAELVPALRSFWLVIHVSVAFVASALFTLGFSLSVLQIVQERRELAREASRPPGRGAFMESLPASAELERSAYRLHVAAFPLWGFTLIAGAIWAEHAWGRYWNWDPKETWTFVIWVVYAAYLHARATRGWDGRRSAYLAMVGYACLLANFLVVNLVAVGLHSYA
jgi:cytochrome c-type biogenesis protein CcsB